MRKKNENYWKLRWYSALRDTQPFKDKYEELSSPPDLTYQLFEPHTQMVVRWGAESPLNETEILDKSIEEIANFIKEFKPDDRRESPSIEGLSNELGKAVSNDPEKFANKIELFQDSSFIYVYHILNGFKTAWEKQRFFDWEKVLFFCKEYIENVNFYSNKLTLRNDGWGANHHWVIGSISELLIEGMESDKNAFSLDLLPIAKEIIKTLVLNLTPSEELEKTNMDYPAYTLNSTGGKVLRALINYSLRRARNLPKSNNIDKWENDVKEIFEMTLTKEIIDSYVLLGWFFPQFNFLDSAWIGNKIKSFYTIDDKNWLPFMGGFAFANPPYNKNVYKLFRPHYERAVISRVDLTPIFEQGTIRHLVALYIWGFENLDDNSLIVLFFNHSQPKFVVEFVSYLSQQNEYVKTLSPQEAVEFEQRVFDLWSYLANKFEKTENSEELKILEALIRLMNFVSKLDENNTSLILKSCGITDEHFHSHYIVEKLVKLKTNENTSETAKYIAQILNSLRFPNHYILDQQSVAELVEFLYQNNQKTIADEFCNKLAKQSHEFLIPIFRKYN